MCIKDVRSDVLPRVSVAVLAATVVPSTNNSNAVPLRLKVIECQVPSNAVPPGSGIPKSSRLLPLDRQLALDVPKSSPICARSFSVVAFEIAKPAATPKSVPPLKRAKRVKLVLSRLGITASFLLA
jgi:hypothetical protein